MTSEDCDKFYALEIGEAAFRDTTGEEMLLFGDDFTPERHRAVHAHIAVTTENTHKLLASSGTWKEALARHRTRSGEAGAADACEICLRWYRNALQAYLRMQRGQIPPPGAGKAHEAALENPPAADAEYPEHAEDEQSR